MLVDIINKWWSTPLGFVSNYVTYFLKEHAKLIREDDVN